MSCRGVRSLESGRSPLDAPNDSGIKQRPRAADTAVGVAHTLSVNEDAVNNPTMAQRQNQPEGRFSSCSLELLEFPDGIHDTEKSRIMEARKPAKSQGAPVAQVDRAAVS